MPIKYKEGNENGVIVTGSITDLVVQECEVCHETKPTVIFHHPHPDQWNEEDDYDFDMGHVCLDCLSASLEELEEAIYEVEE